MTTRPLPVHPQFKENAGSDDTPTKKKGKRKAKKAEPGAAPAYDQGEDTYDEYYENDLMEMSGNFPKLTDNVEPLNNDAAAEAAADLALSAIRSGRRHRSTPKNHDYEKLPLTTGDTPNLSPGRRAAAKIKRMSLEVKNWKEVVVDGDQQGQVVHHEGRLPGHSMSPALNKARKKKPKRRDREHNPLGPSSMLFDEHGLDTLIDEADVVQTHGEKLHDEGQKVPAITPNVIFMEKEDGKGFVKKPALDENCISPDPVRLDVTYTTLDVSHSMQNWFYVITLFIHGILAGFSAWQTLQISKYETDVQFLTEYKSLAWPAASAYFLCLTICVVSSLDILETAITYSKADLLMGMFKNPIHTLTVILYVLALILSCGLSSIDDKLSLYTADSDLWADEIKNAEDVSMWKIINIIRMVLAVLGWFLLSWCFLFSVRPTRSTQRARAGA